MTTPKVQQHRRPEAGRSDIPATKSKPLEATDASSRDADKGLSDEHSERNNVISAAWLSEFDTVNEPIFIHDKAFRILRCNAAYAACAGQPIEAIIGQPYWQVFPKMLGAPGGDAKTPTQDSVEAAGEFTTESGEIFLTRDITAYKASGEFWYSRHSLENITARKRDERVKDRHSSFLEAIIDGVPGIVTVIDRQGKLILWNVGLNTLTGKSDTELREADPLSLVSEADRERMAAMQDELFLTGHAQGEIGIQSADQGIRFLIFSSRRFEVEGVPYGVSFILDQTEFKQLASDLIREKTISDTIIESAPGAFFMLDEAGCLVKWNEFLRDETGLSDEQLRGLQLVSVICEEDRPLAAAKFLTAFATGYAEMEVRVPTRRHGIRHFLKTARRIEVDGSTYLAGFCVDITKRKEAEAALTEEKAFSDALIESAPGAFFVIDMNGNFVRWNSYLNRMMGRSNDEISGQPWLLTLQEEDRPIAAATMRDAFRNGYALAELHVLTGDRGIRLYVMTARRFHVTDSTYLVGIGMDITAPRAKMMELEHEAKTDSLTQIANRGRWLEIAKQEFARCRRYGHPLSLWMLDIDNFKLINDTYGHQAGDVALQALVAISQKALRDWDIMGRLGGEEFAVLLPETDSHHALQVAERLRQEVAGSGISVAEGKTARVTVSTGIATACDADTDIETLLARADHALYEAKETGRDKVCVAGSS